MSFDSSPEAKCSQLSHDLEHYVALALKEEFRNLNDELSCDLTTSLCNVVEAIFINGLKDPFYIKGTRYNKYPQPNFWPLVYKFTDPSILKKISNLSLVKSEIGKARAWVRIHLNMKDLVKHISKFIGDSKAMGQFYNETAFLRDSNLIMNACHMIMKLEMEEDLKINASINTPFLDTWTNDPLVYAGIVQGRREITTVESLIKSMNDKKILEEKRKKSISEEVVDESEEAIVLLNSMDDCETNEPLNRTNDDDNNGSDYNEDAHSSIYSQPSQYADSGTGGIGILDCYGLSPSTSGQFLSSTPKYDSNKFILPDFSPSSTEHLPSAVKFQRRRVKIKRKTSPASMLIKNNDKLNLSKDSGKSFKSDEQLIERCIKENEIDNTIYSSSCPQRALNNGYINQQTMFTIGRSQNSLPEEVLEKDEENFKGYVESSQTSSDKNKLNDSFLEEETMKISKSSTSILSNDKNYTTDNENGISHSFSSGNSFSGFRWRKPSSRLSRNTSFSSMSPSPFDIFKVLGNEVEEKTLEVEEVSKKSEGKRKKSSKKKKTEDEERDNFIKMIKQLPHEEGIDSQNYRCYNCFKSIENRENVYIACNLDKKYYCKNCMKDGRKKLIPSRVILNGDFRQMRISPVYLKMIKKVYRDKIFDIESMNPMIYKYSKRFRGVKEKRTILSFVALYLMYCQESVRQALLEVVAEDDKNVTNIHLYSWKDLDDTYSGELEKRISGYIDFAIKHVYNCPLCSQKGFFCEICDCNQIIYPFQVEETYRCSDCYSVFHRECFDKVNKCPKCVRKKRLAESMLNSAAILFFENR
uniref:RUN domain-containing protein n=1 Tax=Parastrongyloides trichosuri TaxID=131310 RepID=A0A0N4ZA17_PARTI